MTILFYAPASPYSAKVVMAAKMANIDIQLQVVSTSDEPKALLDANPLGKIPTLVLDDGTAVFDSRTIMSELDRLSGKMIFPRSTAKRGAAERMEAAGDGMCDALLAQVYERRMRPEEKVHQPWIDYQARKVERALDWFEATPTRFGKTPHGGQIALYAALGYADLRFPNLNWGRGRPKLRRFVARFEEIAPDLVAFKPSA
ncbi:MAG: glutathione S-transferase family protein [Ahrensia sp.]